MESEASASLTPAAETLYRWKASLHALLIGGLVVEVFMQASTYFTSNIGPSGSDFRRACRAKLLQIKIL